MKCRVVIHEVAFENIRRNAKSWAENHSTVQAKSLGHLFLKYTTAGILTAMNGEHHHPAKTNPVCTVIAGPNGSGKTTFALTYLRSAGHSRNFVNADLIAAGLSPLSPEKEAIEAGRLFLREVHRFVADGESILFIFGFQLLTHVWNAWQKELRKEGTTSLRQQFVGDTLEVLKIS